jgi:putative membrane protein
MRSFIVHFIVIALALAGTAYLLPGVSVASGQALALGALALGLMNAVVRPVLAVLTLPITVVTLGLFYLVVNAASFALAAWVVPGFDVVGFWPAVGGALVFSVISTVLGWFTGGDQKKRDR